MTESVITTTKTSQEFLKSFNEYILAGHKLLDAWISLDQAQLEVIGRKIFPFSMSFDEYLAKMATIKFSLEKESGF